EATPIYFGFAKWKGGEGGVWPDVFVIGFDPASHVFVPESIDRQLSVLSRADTLLVDSATRPIFGPLDIGRMVEVGARNETIGGQYVLGTGFMGLGVVLASARNFARLFQGRGVDIVNLGAIVLKPGFDADRAAADWPRRAVPAPGYSRARNWRLPRRHIGRHAPRSGSSLD